MTRDVRHRRQRRSSKAPWGGILACLAVICLFQAGWLSADPGDDHPIEFVRIQMPMKLIVKHGQQQRPHPFFPMKQKEFDELLDMVRRRGEASTPASITAARYTARFSGDTLTDGTAKWDIEHSGEGEVVLPIGKSRFAIGDAQWEGSPPEPAELGLDDRDRHVLLVPESGTLSFPWSLRGKRSRQGVQFPLELPAAMVAEMLLDLPAGATPSLESGVVTPTSTPASTPMTTPAGAGDEKLVRWRLELGAARSNVLTISVDQDEAGIRRPRFTHDAVYRMSPSGLELQTELRFEEMPRQLVLAVSPDLRMDAKLGDTKLSLEQVAPHKLIVDLPSGRSERIVRLSGFAELPMDVLWTLPQVTVEEGAQWREGKTRFLIAKTLTLQHLRVEGARQTSRRRQADGGEELRFRMDEATPSLRVDLQPRRQVLRSEAGVTIRWNEDQVTAATVIDVSAQWGESFTIPLAIPPDWKVNSVETRPANALDAEQLRLTATKGVLQVPLLKPVAPDSPVQIRLTAHRVVLGGQKSLPGRLLFVGQPIGMPWEGLLSIQGELSNDYDLVRVDPQRENVKRLVQTASNGVVVEYGAGVDQLTVASPPQRPEFTFEMHVEAAPGKGQLEERYRLRCVPVSGAISQVRLQMSSPIKALQWSLHPSARGTATADDRSMDNDGAAVTARLVVEEEDANDTREVTQGRRWDLLLPRPQSAPFDLVATRRRDVGGASAILSLPSAPEAVSQTGAISVLNTMPVRILANNEAGGLKHVPAPTPPPGDMPKIQAAFRYEPSTPEIVELLAVLDPTIDSSSGPSRRIHAWSHHLLTRQETSGAALHQATFRLETFGDRKVDVTAPANVEVLRATLDGVSLPLETETISVKLPEQRRQATLRVVYRSTTSPLTWKGNVEAPLLRLSAPVLESRWTVLTPPGYGELKTPPSVIGRITRLIDLRDRDDIRESARRAMRLLYDAPDVRNWGDLLAAVHRRSEAGRLAPVLVHSRRLAELGISPRTPLPPRRDFLQRSGVDLHSYEDVVVLSDAFQRDNSDQAIGEFHAVPQWLASMGSDIWPAESNDVWAIDHRWRRTDRILPATTQDATTVSAKVSYLPTLYSVAIALAVICVGLCYRCTPSTVLRVVMIGWLTAVIAPGAWSLWGAAIGWGGLLGGLVGCGWRGQVRLQPWLAAPAAVAVAAACLVLTADEPKRADHLYRVLQPIDAEGNPEGEYIYVPMPLRDVLHQAKQEALAAPQGWVTTHAKYDVHVPSQDAREADEAPTVTATYRIRVFQAGQISLPLMRDDGPVLKTTLDGGVVRSDWNETGDRLFVPIENVGVREVVVVRKLTARLKLDGRGIEMKIPPVPTAELTGVASSQQTFSAPSTYGSVAAGPGRLRAQLGATAQLSTYWSASPGNSTGRSIEEHLWLQVKRLDSVVVDALFRCQSEDNQLGSLRLLADNRLRLLSMNIDGEEVSPKIQSASSGNILTIALPEDKSSTEVHASFHLTGVSGVGRIQPPVLTTLSSEATRRWFALSVLANEMEGVIMGDVQPIDSEQFTVSWPAASDPLKAVRVGDGDLGVVVRYAQPGGTAQQVAKLTLTRQLTGVAFTATLSDLGALTLQHVLRVPKNFRIEDLRVLEGDREATQRHAIDEAGNLTIFLDQPAKSEQRIEILGDVSAGRRGRALPRIELTSTEVESRQIEIYRRSDVGDVRLDQVRNAVVDTSLAGKMTEVGRLVAQLRPESERYNARILAGVNNFRGETQLVSVLRRHDNQWTVEVKGQVEVASGELDQLRLRVPKTLSAVLQPPTGATITALSLEEHDEWRIVPDRPVENQFEFRLLAALESGDDGVLRAPNISVQGVPSRQFVALPRRADRQQIDWIAPRGLQAIERPVQSAQSNILGIVTDGHDLYEVMDRRFEATVQRVERVTGSPLVQLADIHLSWHDKQCQGLAVFDLESAGANSCQLSMPPGSELISVTVNDIVKPVTRTAEGNYEVPLGASFLPHRLTVTYRAEVTHRDQQRVLPAPTLPLLETARTLWTVASYDEVDVATADLQASETRNELRRLETISNLLVFGADAAADRPLDEVTNWYGPWVRRWLNSYRKLSRMDLSKDDRARVASFLSMQNSVATRLRMEGLFRQVREDSWTPPTQSDIRQAALSSHSPLCFASQGGSQELVITTPSVWEWPWQLGLLLGGLAIWAITQWLPLAQWHAQWPAVFVALVGVTLVVVLPIPGVGWSVIGLAMLASRR